MSKPAAVITRKRVVVAVDGKAVIETAGIVLVLKRVVESVCAVKALPSTNGW